MVSYSVAFIMALATAAVLTPLIRNFSFKLKLYDAPNDRKLHDRAIPRTGGIAIAIAFFIPTLGIALTEANIGKLVYENSDAMLAIFVGGILIMLVGLADDLKGMRARWKFLLQAAVASLAFWMGFRIEAVSLPFGGMLEMGFFSYVITVVWIVGIINAVNLIDGLDGLAGGIAFFVLVFNFMVAVSNNSFLMALVAAALAGAVLGFLFYNFNPASIFMGDAGSMFIGYVLALAAVNSGQKSSTTVALLTPIVAMGVPIMDTLFSMVRRFLERQPLFAPDKGHIHHRLLAMGLNHKRSVLVLYGFAVFLVIVAALLHFGGKWQIGVALVIVLVTLAVFARVVGVADYVSRRRATRMGIRTKHAEALRKHCFDAQRRAGEIDSAEELHAFLEWLLQVADMKFVEVCAESEEPVLTVENAAYLVHEREPLVTATIPLFDGSGKERGLWRFGWHSERGRVTTVTETLLQIIADRTRLDSQKT
jgi:UDP-GlcNAc:undecaprenyl-phosphate/decaprenyl-phosphate GlcNAc-1-phosphate transferase